LITIGMPIKNRAFCIDRVLRNMEELDYPKNKLKIVFVDDYSTDGTYEKLCEWRDKMKDRYYGIILIRSRSNIPQARNICVKNMEGDYILFWDSDAIVPKDALRKALNLLKREKEALAVAATSYLLVDPQTLKIWGHRYGLGFGFTLIKKEVFTLVGTFNELFYSGEEEIFVRLEERTPYKVVDLPFPYIHLKPKPPFKVKIRNYLNNLRRYFGEYSEIYLRGFSKLALRYKIRLPYYLLLPWVLIITFITSLYHTTLLFIASMLMVIYLIVGLVYNICKATKRRRTRDIIKSYFMYNVPCGLAFAYGVLVKAIQRLLKRGK